MKLKDDLLTGPQRQDVYDFLNEGWRFGWQSKRNKDTYSFWHRHFAGARLPDHPTTLDHEEPYDCAEELAQRAPLLSAFWTVLSNNLLGGHKLVRCYANALQYGSDGTLHTDSVSPDSFTTIYYPHEKWAPDWGGETVFFNKEQTDVIGCVYPKPNRLITFSGVVPHVARGVSRTCPVLRITLMFKTEYIRVVPDGVGRQEDRALRADPV